MAGIKKVIQIPELVEVRVDKKIYIKGPKGEIGKDLLQPGIDFLVEDRKITITSKKSTKKVKRVINTIAAHVKNMINGVLKGYEYRLKMCSSHFPMNVSISGNELIIKNFLGEKFPRTMRIKEGVDAKVVKDEIILSGIDKETVGQVAADIEQLTRITNRDRRVFQDGIYITQKG